MRALLQLAAPAVVIAVGVSAAFLAAGFTVFPMDDAYIHFVYARNLAEHGQLTYNLNPGDPGVGTTSILWTLSLAALQPLFGTLVAARLLGIAAYLLVVVLAVQVASWMTPRERPQAAWICGLLVALSGNLLWFSLSGMETMLWVALGLGALVAYRHERFGWLGVLLGLLMLTRIEGFALVGALLAVDTFAGRRLRRGMVVAVAIALALLLPWLLYVHNRTGHLLPTSFAGKKQAQMRAAVELLNRTLGQDTGGEQGELATPERAELPWYSIFVYPIGAFSYVFSFVVGAAYLPGPTFPTPGPVRDLVPGLAYLAVILLLGLFLPLFVRGLQRAGRVASSVVAGSDDGRRRALLALALWVVLHGIAYWIKLPTPGTASRYQVLNHLAFWLLAGACAWWIRRPPLRRGVVAALLVLAAANAAFWWGVYASNVRHMREVRLEAAEWARANLPADAVVAAHDIGALGWSMDRRIVDLGALIDPAYLDYARERRVPELLRERGVDYLILPTKHTSEQHTFADYAGFLGLRRPELYTFEPVAHFENDYDDWRRGVGPTWNALAGVTIYRLDWSDAQ